MNDYYNEKDIVDIELLKDNNILLGKRDLTKEYDSKSNKYIYKINFTGFEVGNKGRVLYFFPYKYKVNSLVEDGELLFKTIYKHVQRRPELYFGDSANKEFKSNYPFESFFDIYNYYLENGLFVDYFNKVTTRRTGKINWKYTISKSNKYILDDMIFFPTPYYRNIWCRTNLITDCMAFALEYTVEKFSFIFGTSTLGLKYTDLNFIDNKELIIRELLNLNSKIFNSKTKKLLDSLIRFFKGIKVGGNFYIKHYNFESIWEDMVQKYLNNKFRGVIENSLDLSGNNEQNHFKKETFYPNLINRNHYIQPDCILRQNDNIYILDAKYYCPTGIDYKQVCYSLFLVGNVECLKNIYSALIVPSEIRETKEYFLMDNNLNRDLKNLKINIEYLDIRDVMEEWI